MSAITASRLRVLAMTVVLTATAFTWNAAPRPVPSADEPTSAPLPFGLGPLPALAAYCATPNAAFTGFLTQQLVNSGTPSVTARTTSGTVYPYISNIDTTWACTLYRRYDGVAWVETLPDEGTFDWGTIINSTSVGCNWVVGTTDYEHANSSATCHTTDTTNVLSVQLQKDGGTDMEGVFQPDTAHNSVGDFMYVHSDCDTTGYYGAESVRWNATFGTSTSANRPGALCDVPTFDATGTSQTLIYDHTAPTSGSISIANGATYTGSTIVPLTLGASDAVAGLSQMRFSNNGSTWSTWETYATSKSGWDLSLYGGSSVEGVHTVYVQYSDLNGNASGSFTDQITLDLSAPSPNPPDVMATTTGSVYQAATNGTVFFRPAAASSITLTASATDAVSGVAFIRFATLSPTTGWTPSPALPNQDTVAPYTESLAFTASAGTSTIAVDSQNGAGITSSARTVSLTADSAGPTTTFTSPPAGTTTQSSEVISVSWSESDGTGSGVASRSLQRQATGQTGPGTCNAAGWANDGSAVTSVSPVSVTGLLANTCYRWVETLTDRVGNSLATTSGALIRDTSANLGQQRQHAVESWSLGGGDTLAVNTANGNLVLSHPLVSLPIRGSALSIDLTYNRQDAASAGMGPGWRLNVFRRLAVNADASVTFIDGDGARYTFTNPQTVGTVTTYTRPAALYANLVKDTSLGANEFVLTYRHLSVDRFDILGSEGILVRSEDRFGNGVTHAYVAGTNRLSTITDTAASRTVDFTWDASNRLSQITDWAWIDGAGVVQTGASGARRVYRFFYDANGNLAGWSDPLNTSGSCPTGGSHLTCVTYPTNELDIAKTQTVEAAGATALTTSARTITAKVTFAGSNVASVRDPQQVADAATGTTFTWESPTSVRVDRPTTTTAYLLQTQNDAFARVSSVLRTDVEDSVSLERRTTWDSAYPTEPATVVENYGALLGAPARTTTYTYAPASLGLVGKVVEPLTASTNRWTEYVYNANNDVTLKTVSQDGSGTLRTVTRSCYTTQSLTCATSETGLTLVRQIENWVSGGAQNNDTNVVTDYTYDAYGQRTRVQRHDRDAAGSVRDDRITASVYDATGAVTREIANYVDGVVTNGTTDTTPGTDSVRTDLTTVSTYDTAGNRVSTADPRRAIGLVIPASTTKTFNPTDDAHVRDAFPTTSYGTDPTLEVRATGGSQGAYEAYLMFTVTGLVGTVTNATLRLTNTVASNKSTRDVCVYRVPTTTWAEGTITWNTKPTSDATSIACVHGDQAAGTIDYDLGANVPGPGIWAFRLTNSTTFDVTYASKEAASGAPQLILTVSYGPLGSDDFVARQTYDALNHAVSETTPTTYGVAVTQKTSTTRYDELGAIREATDFAGVTTGTEFDRAGRATKTFEDTDPAAGAPVTTSIATYDGDGRTLTTKDRAQAASSSLGYTANTYDSLGRLTATTEATGTADESLTTSTFDALDRRLTLTVGGQDTTYAYDLGGRTTSTDDGFACTTSTFDYRGLALTTTSGLVGGTCATTGAAWRTVTTSYDGLGRAFRAEQTASSSGAGDGDRTQDDVLDAAGDRLSASVRRGGVTTTTTYTVTILDEVVAESRADGSTTKKTYDPAGNVADSCYWKAGATVGDCTVVGTVPWTNPPTQSTSAVFDARNSRIQQVDGLTNQVTTYDPDHNYLPAAVYLPTGSGRELQSIYAYDARHRLTGITHQLCVLADVAAHTCTSTSAAGSDAYAYDENDSRTRVTEANGATSADTFYCYDARNQLTKVAAAAGCASPTESYTYDDAGNRLTGGGRSFTYSADGQLTSCTNPACSVTYDSAGRISTYTDAGVTWSYSYDAAGRLTSACKAASCSGSGFDRLDMTYDGEGHRTKVTETPAAGSPVTTRDFRYQGDAVVEELVNGTSVRTIVVDEAGSPVKVTVTNSGATNGTYMPVFSGHGDLLALWRLEADGTLTLANTVTYTTWGRPTLTAQNGIADLGFRRLYVGRSDVWWDDAYGAGLLYMHARSYVPALGRFLQPDPVAAEGNLYAYAENSPVTKADPSGNRADLLEGSAGFGGGGGGLVITWYGATTLFGAATGWLAAQHIRICLWGCGSSGVRVQSWTCYGRGGCILLSRQDKKLSPGDIELLKRRGIDPEELKDHNGALDLFKKPNGDVVVKPRSGIGPGEPTGKNLKELAKRGR